MPGFGTKDWCYVAGFTIRQQFGITKLQLLRKSSTVLGTPLLSYLAYSFLTLDLEEGGHFAVEYIWNTPHDFFLALICIFWKLFLVLLVELLNSIPIHQIRMLTILLLLFLLILRQTGNLTLLQLENLELTRRFLHLAIVNWVILLEVWGLYFLEGDCWFRTPLMSPGITMIAIY